MYMYIYLCMHACNVHVHHNVFVLSVLCQTFPATCTCKLMYMYIINMYFMYYSSSSLSSFLLIYFE